MDKLDKRKLLSVICHASPLLGVLVFPVIVPIVIIATTEDTIVKANAKESIHFFINIFACGIIANLLSVILIGFLIFPLLFVVSVVIPIMAVIQVINNPEEAYRYPFILRFF